MMYYVRGQRSDVRDTILFFSEAMFNAHEVCGGSTKSQK